MKIGIDWGGTKIEGIAIDSKNGKEINRIRVDSPKNNYDEIISKVVEVIENISKGSSDFTVGIGMPGSIHPETNLVQVSNTKALENKPVKIIVGPNKVTGEWGQNPIPGPMDQYEKSVKRHCGRVGAVEVFLSGPGLENYYEHITKTKISSRDIVSLYQKNDSVAGEVMDVYFERIARSFSTFVNIIDPDVIVCGGGMSEIDEIYDEVPNRIIPYIASNFFLTPIVKATHGSSSGVRGAAHLWN